MNQNRYHNNLNTVTGLTLDEVRKAAPSVFTQEPYYKVSGKYVFVPTLDILQAMMEAGFRVTYATEGRTTIEDKKLFVKHMLWLAPAFALGTEIAEMYQIGIENGHAANTAYRLHKIVWRKICSNGLHAWESDGDVARIRHSGRAPEVVNNVVDSTLRYVDDGQTTMEQIERMKNTLIDRNAQIQIARSAMHTRFERAWNDEHPEQSVTAFRPENFLRPRVYDDIRNTEQQTRENDGQVSVWQALNNIQYNFTTGGVTTYVRDGRETHKKTTREIKETSIDKRVELNQVLWKSGIEAMRAKLQEAQARQQQTSLFASVS